MDIKKAEIGDRVYHSRGFGFGQIVAFDFKSDRVRVKFDKPTNGISIRNIDSQFLARINTFKSNHVFKFQVGDKVFHDKRYGLGTIISRNSSGRYEVLFIDEKGNNADVREMCEQYLQFVDVESAHQISEIYALRLGDRVIHSKYGDATFLKCLSPIEVEIKTSDTSENKICSIMDVRKNYGTRKISIRGDLFTDDELESEEYESRFHIIPSNYSTLTTGYSTDVKKFLTYLRKYYANENGVATIKAYEEQLGYTGLIILQNKGVVIFRLFDNDSSIDAFQNILFEQVITKQMENVSTLYFNKFSQSKLLTTINDDGERVLKFPVKVVYIYQSVNLKNHPQSELEKIVINNKNIYFRNLSTIFNNNEVFEDFSDSGNILKYDKDFDKIDDKYYGSIIERVIPENTTLVTVGPEVVDTKTPDITVKTITGQEREFSALCLDDSQIKFINDTKVGCYLTLANPGTGKSVLLISKAYLLRSKNEQLRILITCFNNNLAERHRTFATISGLASKSDKLTICTFHKLAIDILSREDPIYFNGLDMSDESKYYEAVVDRLISLIAAGKIKYRFNAIFIDEIQLFEPKWIDACFSLLASDTDYVFEMYGDLNQDVKASKSKGKAPWQIAHLPSLQGRVRKLDINYRNTDIISNYLKCFIDEFNGLLRKYNVSVDEDNTCKSSRSNRKGSIRTKIILSGHDDTYKVIRVIDELVNKQGAEYNDIAIIYPARGYTTYYQPITRIREELEKRDIPSDFISGEPGIKTTLYDCDGIVFSTIDSSMGLDFKYVIFCGLHYWDFVHINTDKGTRFTKDLLLQSIDAKAFLSEVGKKIYAACSRARDGLFIIDDLEQGSPIKKILRPDGGKDCYDEVM